MIEMKSNEVSDFFPIEFLKNINLMPLFKIFKQQSKVTLYKNQFKISMSTPPKHSFPSITPPKCGKIGTTPPKYPFNDPNSKFAQLFNAAPLQFTQSDPNTHKNHDNSPLSSSSQQQQHIETLQNQINSKIQQMKHFKEQMKRRRVEQQIEEKEEENPFVVKESYVDRELKKLNHLGNKGELKIVENGKQEEDQDEMEKKVQEILKKINL